MIVVDASVAYKWTDKEDADTEVALQILRNHVIGKVRIIVPDLILYELGNAWATKSRLKLARISLSLKDLQDAELEFEPVSFGLVRKTINFSKKYNVSVYDASYAVLAKEKKCNLVTADDKFVKQVNLRYVKYLGDLG